MGGEESLGVGSKGLGRQRSGAAGLGVSQGRTLGKRRGAPVLKAAIPCLELGGWGRGWEEDELSVGKHNKKIKVLAAVPDITAPARAAS